MISNLFFLVVDDMEVMRRILTNSLHQMGVKNVKVAVNGADAWRMLQSQPVDVVISDWNMPVMSGLELVQKIRASTEFANLPILMMTAVTEPHQVKMAIESGVSEYLIKPFSAGALESKIRKAVNQPLPALSPSLRPVPAILPSRALAPQPGSDARKSTLLIVDDVPDNLQLLVGLLSDSYQVKAAINGEQALKALAGGSLPDLILLDVAMPKMDGYEVCRRIKANPATADIPIIFLTSMDRSNFVARGFEAGAVDFVTKPADPPILRARIETHLKLRRSIAELKRNRLSLIEQNAILQDNIRLRDEFQRMARHDLKSPLTGMLNFASDLLNDASLAGEHKEIIRYIEQSAYSVLGMVNLSLDLYKMEQGSYECSPSTVDLVQLLRRTVQEMTSEMAARGIHAELLRNGAHLDEAASVPILCDEFLCQSMFSNLLQNAMEAAGPNTVIQIDLYPQPTQVSVRMSNSGAVPKDLRETFFDKFTTSGKAGGTGLGTFTARLIARTHGGDISMTTSDELNSTTVCVNLPYQIGADCTANVKE